MFNVKKKMGSAATLASVALLAACDSPPVETISIDNRPSVAAYRSSTNFSSALSCLDSQLLSARDKRVPIAVGAMPDTTGEVAVSMRDMTINAITEATMRSRAFVVVDPIRSPFDINTNLGSGGTPLPSGASTQRLPRNTINLTGSITQVSAGDYDRNIGAGLDFARGGPAYSRVSQLSSISTHMRTSRKSDGIVQISSKREMTLQKNGHSVRVFVGAPEIGAALSYSVDKDDSVSKAVETLVHLQIIEIIGKTAGVPYWECLSKPSTSVEFNQEVSNDWNEMDGSERKQAAESKLQTLGYGGSFALALRTFQRDVGQPPTGRLDAVTFADLDAALVDRQVPQTSVSAMQASDIGLRLSASSDRSGVNRSLTVSIEQPGFVNCFYRAEDGVIAKIYPNPAQPLERLTPGTILALPDTQNEFKIVAPNNARQDYACYASQRHFTGQLPMHIQANDFRDLRRYGIDSLAELNSIFRSAGVIEFKVISYPSQ